MIRNHSEVQISVTAEIGRLVFLKDKKGNSFKNIAKIYDFYFYEHASMSCLLYELISCSWLHK
jgi:hypothetical protein